MRVVVLPLLYALVHRQREGCNKRSWLKSRFKIGVVSYGFGVEVLLEEFVTIIVLVESVSGGEQQ